MGLYDSNDNNDDTKHSNEVSRRIDDAETRILRERDNIIRISNNIEGYEIKFHIVPIVLLLISLGISLFNIKYGIISLCIFLIVILVKFGNRSK